jgi:peroxidase
MARDAVVLARGPSWPVALGRRDGTVSSATEAANELPPAFGDVPLLTKIFASKGLDLEDLVVLSGAHTLGTAHCPSYADRLQQQLRIRPDAGQRVRQEPQDEVQERR